MLAGTRLGEWLDRYWAEWRDVRPMLNGDDLRALGLPPGPLYTRLLDRLLAAWLDGEVNDEAAERELLGELVGQ